MAEEEVAGHAAHSGIKGLTQKVGPLPIYAWIAIGLVVYLYIQRKSSSSTTAPANQKDPAGNIGSIDPATGYVYGSAEDKAAMVANGASSNIGGDSSNSGSGTGSVAGQYQTNADWGRAAVNYLVGLGIDPTTANQAIQLYLSSQNLTSPQQADVNEAIQALGAPPSLPGPSTTNPPPITTPPGGSPTNASNPPDGLAVTANNTTSIGLKWNSVANATGYTVAYGTTPDASQWNTATPAGQPGVTVGNLSPGTSYYFKVQGTPASSGAGWAGPILGKTSNAAPVPTPAPSPSPSPAPGPHYIYVTVVPWTARNPPWNSTLWGIATHYNVPGGYQALASLNGISNPSLIHPGQQIKVPA